MQENLKESFRIISPEEILQDIRDAVIRSRPFSLIRFGDGGLKVMRGILDGQILYGPWRKEGIPMNFFEKMLDWWVEVANEADYIDSPLIYFEDELHKKRDKTSQATWDLLSKWDFFYKKAGININRKFCSPEIAHLLFCRDFENNLTEFIINRDICCITNFYEVERILADYTNSITIKLIPGFTGNHYRVCFESIIKEIEEEATNYSLWLVSAGELGRLYTGQIKRFGGRAIDIGKVIDAWVTRVLDHRMRKIVRFDDKHELLFNLNE